jgi:membrane protease YdiL (CAAX protease family)
MGAASGCALGAAVLLALRFFLLPAIPALGTRLAAEVSLPAATRWIIAFDAAVLEELLYRLFLVSSLIVALRRIAIRPGRLSAAGTIRIAVAVTALLFAAAHLPRWAEIVGGASWLVLGVVLLLNAIGGMVFGVVYVRRGIEAAMLAHFAADVVLHVIGPWFAGAPAAVPA